MGLLNSSQFIKTSLKDVTVIDTDFRRYFEGNGYNVSIESTPFQGFYSITKGGIFKQIAGMRTGLNAEIKTVPGGINVEIARCQGSCQ